MKISVQISNAEWLEGCADTEDHEHPSEFEALVDVPDCCDELTLSSAIHDALIEQCGCCIIDCSMDIMEVIYH